MAAKPIRSCPVLPLSLRLLSIRRPTSGGLGTAAASALAHASENAAYGLLAFAPLGMAFGPVALLLALLAAPLANAVGAALGGGRLAAGPRASLALLTAGTLSALLQRLPQDSALPWSALALMALSLAAAGALQALFGLLRLGSLVKYTPHPVRTGLTSGVGLLLVLTALPVLLGSGFGTDLAHALARPSPSAVAIGLLALGLMALAQRWPRLRLPPVLVGLLGAMLAQGALQAAGATTAPGLGSPQWAAPWFLQAGAASVLLHLDREVLALLAGHALTVAVLCSLDTLLAVSVVDGQLRRARDANRELLAQGLANVAVAGLGGPATSPSIPRSLGLLGQGRGGPRVSAAYVACLAGLLPLAPLLLGHLPAAAVAGVLLLQGLQMVAASLWRTPHGLLRAWRNGEGGPAGRPAVRLSAGLSAGLAAPQRLLLANWAVAMTVAACALLLGLGPAVLIGALCAVLLFVRANMREVVAGRWTGASRHSLKMRPAAAVQALQQQGERTAVLQLQGALFFGTADSLRSQLLALERQAETVVLDLHQIVEIDVTAARILVETSEDLARQGRRLVLAEWPPGDLRRQVLEGAAGDTHGLLHFADDTDAALEAAEDRLLHGLDLGLPNPARLSLADTLLGRNLAADELALLQQACESCRFERGALIFRQGDPGDALYLSLSGDIGLRIPGSRRRLASFAPGVCLGEISLLAGGTRSAEAFAETEVQALRLSAEAWQRLLDQHPALGAKLLRSLSLHLADRLRVVTGDLAHWVSRSAQLRAGAGPMPMAPPDGEPEERAG